MEAVLVPGISAIIVAAITAYITYRLEIKRLIQSKVELEISIQHGNFLKLYEKRLEGLKAINHLNFDKLKVSVQEISGPDDSFLEPICFKVGDIQNELKEIILKYGCLFNSQLRLTLTESYDYCEEMFLEVDFKENIVSKQALAYAYEIKQNITQVIETMEKDLFLDSEHLRTLLQRTRN